MSCSVWPLSLLEAGFLCYSSTALAGGYSCVTPYPLHLFLRTFQQPNPFCCNRSTTNLFMISFLSRTIDIYFFFLSLWIYLWLAETSQQPISQTTWLKVTPHCNHCNHCRLPPITIYHKYDCLAAFPLPASPYRQLITQTKRI